MPVQQTSSWAFFLAWPLLFLWLKWNDDNDNGDVQPVSERAVLAKQFQYCTSWVHMIPWHLWYRFYYCGHFTDEGTEWQRGWVIYPNTRLIHSVSLRTVEVAHAKPSHGAWVAVRPQNGSRHFSKSQQQRWLRRDNNKSRMNKELEQSSISLILRKTLWVQLPGNSPTGLLLHVLQ